MKIKSLKSGLTALALMAFLVSMALQMTPALAETVAPSEEVVTVGHEKTAQTETTNVAEVETSETFIQMSSWYERFVASSTGEGGSLMIVLGFFSVAGVGFALERFLHLKRSIIIPGGLSVQAMDLWKNKKYDDILTLTQSAHSTLASIITALVKFRHRDVSELSQMAADISGRDIRGELQRAYPIQVIATVAPLLGLLGTVMGMVLAFEKVSGAGSLGNAAILADDISLALMTTMAGLLVAAPTLTLYHYFRSKTLNYNLQLEAEVDVLLSEWFMSVPEKSESNASTRA
jgi:biopolymer transport protein ExbB